MLTWAPVRWHSRARVGWYASIREARSPYWLRQYATIVQGQNYRQNARDVREDDVAAGFTDKSIGVSMGIVGTRDAAKTTVEELLEQIKPHTDDSGPTESRHPALLTLLLTPTFGGHALSGHLPLRVVERLCGAKFGQPLDVITAVVDRLPTKMASSTGKEGLGYMLQHRPQTPLTKSAPLDPNAQKAGSITFEGRHRNGLNEVDYTAQLPLAQTIFSTGMVSTLVRARYELNSESRLVVKEREQYLETHGVRLPISHSSSSRSLNVPLLPLTPSRRVTNNMGNIVRTLSSEVWRPDMVHETSSGSQAASTELETAVSKYFKACDIAPEPVQVWALLVNKPERYPRISTSPKLQTLLAATPEQLSDGWTSPENETVRDLGSILDSIMQSCDGRLCKVLSGGGGWGKKAGLLSLDPDTMYSVRDLRGERGWEIDFDSEDGTDGMEKQRKAALGDIVRDGDTIQFFLAPRDLQSPRTALSRSIHGEVAQNPSFLFGAIPSTIDADSGVTPQPSPQSSIDEGASKVSLEKDFFGVLSEGGMAITVSDGPRVLVQTKLDVPFATMRIEDPTDE